MPGPRYWTDADDGLIRDMRSGGASWDAIAARVLASRWSVIERGKALGVHDGEAIRHRAPPMDVDERNREPMAAGHPISWGLITAGTTLEGTAYPEPRRARINARAEDRDAA